MNYLQEGVPEGVRAPQHPRPRREGRVVLPRQDGRGCEASQWERWVTCFLLILTILVRNPLMKLNVWEIETIFLLCRHNHSINSETLIIKCTLDPSTCEACLMIARARKWGILTPYPEAEWVFSPENIMPPRPIERSSRAEGAWCSREEKTHSAEGQVWE